MWTKIIRKLNQLLKVVTGGHCGGGGTGHCSD